MIRLKKTLNLFLVTLMMFSSFFVYIPMAVLALDDEEQYEKISGLIGIPSDFVKAGNNIFYKTSTDEGITELHKTDGTDSGTLLLKTFGGADDIYIYSNLFALGDNVYFTGYTPETGSELWISDGTVEGTRLLIDNYPGSSDGAYSPLYVFNNKLYFIGIDEVNGMELWISDGTAEGTNLLKDANEGTSGGDIRFINVLCGYLYYVYINETNNAIQLWKTDGTIVGTTMVKENFGYPDEEYSVVYNDELYFKAETDEEGYELWKTDGTAEGTFMIKDIYEGSESSNPTDLVVLNGKLYFTAETIISYDEEEEEYIDENRVFVTNGTEEGTVILEEFVDIEVYSISEAVALNGVMYFTHDDNSLYGDELWRSDGTAAGTYIVKDIVPGDYGSEPWKKKVIGDKLYFIVGNELQNEGEYFTELWVSDGTEAGTKMLKSHLGFGMGYLDFYNFDDVIYYQQANNYVDVGWGLLWAADLELWKYTPTSEVSSYTVTFKDYNGMLLKTETVEEGSNATAPANPTRTGYSFTGWDVTFNNITSDLIVTAQYSINTYTVTFKDYDGTVLKNQTVNYGSNAIAPTNPTRNGYIFKGWNNSYSNVTGNVVTTALYSFIGLNNTVEEEITEPEIVINDVTNSINTSDLNTIKKNIKILNENNELISLYDVNLILNGSKIQPNGYIDIRILMTAEQKEYENLKVIYINDDNEVTILPHTIDGNYIVFSVDHLSNYAIIGTKMIEKTETDVTSSVDDNVDDSENKNSGIFTVVGNHPFVFGGIIIVILFTVFIIIKRRKKDEKR